MEPLHVLSFTCILKQHLGVNAQEAHLATLNPPPSATPQLVGLRGIIRGSVKTHRLTPEIEDVALRIRHQVPALTALPKIDLKFSEPTQDTDTVTPLIIVDPQQPRTIGGDASLAVPGMDQCLFGFEGDESRPSTKAYRERATIAGLASTRVDIGDEIWQFERTPLALVARRAPTGYTLVGRAYLFRELSTGCHSDSSEAQFRSHKLEDDLVWVKNANLHDNKTPLIQVDVSGLLRLMTWVTYDK